MTDTHPSIGRVLIPEHELAPFVPGDGQAHRARGLLLQQKRAWELLRTGYDSLRSVRTRTLQFDGFQIKVQFNPGRLASTSAKVDATSIRQRKCFLCLDNLPLAQRALSCEGDYLLLCNPFPIFPEHFTIPTVEHRPQLIAHSFDTLLRLSRDLGELYTVFYNGPKCGASAPDHMHLQAGLRSFLPLDREYDAVKGNHSGPLFRSHTLAAYAVDNYLRHFFSFESSDPAVLSRAFAVLHQALSARESDGEEPLLNILGFWQNHHWRLVVFPRARHRPAFYFRQGGDQLLISPAAVEMGGVCTTPREQDFANVTRAQLIEMFEEVCISKADFVRLKHRLQRDLAAVG